MIPRPNPYDLTTHDGKTVDWLTKAALLKAERILGYPLSITQGSYNAGKVSASAGTHDGGGVVDLRAWDWQSKVRALRLSGFVAWHRNPSEGPWPEHIHAVLMDNRKLSAGARTQIAEYHRGENGLANHHADPHQGFVFRGFAWPYYGWAGLARWHRDQLPPKQRRGFLKRLKRVAAGK